MDTEGTTGWVTRVGSKRITACLQAEQCTQAAGAWSRALCGPRWPCWVNKVYRLVWEFTQFWGRDLKGEKQVAKKGLRMPCGRRLWWVRSSGIPQVTVCVESYLQSASLGTTSVPGPGKTLTPQITRSRKFGPEGDWNVSVQPSRICVPLRRIHCSFQCYSHICHQFTTPV